MLYNSHKQLVACGDAFPTKWTVKVDKEDYVLRVHVRSENKAVLDKLTDLPLLLTSKLTNSGVSMDIYTSHDQVLRLIRSAPYFGPIYVLCFLTLTF